MSQAAFLYNQQHKNQIQSICASLEYFGIACFHYHKIYKNSQHIMLTNKLELNNDFLHDVDHAHVFYKESLPVPNNYSQTHHVLLWPDMPHSQALEVWFKHGFWNGLSILKPSDNYFEFWCFTAKKENNAIQDFYRTHVNIFFDFVNYFNNEMQGALEQSQRSLTFFKNGFDSSFPDRKTEFLQEQTNIKAFYKHITSKGFKVKSKNGLIKLTPAEIKCLHYLAKGQSAKEIARELSITHRTVETHLEHIKNKSGYRLKSDIVNLFHEQLETLIIPAD